MRTTSRLLPLLAVALAASFWGAGAADGKGKPCASPPCDGANPPDGSVELEVEANLAWAQEPSDTIVYTITVTNGSDDEVHVRSFVVETGSIPYFVESAREAPLAEDVSPTLLARAEEFDALMVEQGLTGLVFEDPTDVTYVHDFGYAPAPGEDRDYRAVEWAFEEGPVEARFALHEGLTDDRIVGERLTITGGRGTAAGDAWIDAVIQTLVRWNEPDLPESQIVDLAADLAASTGMYVEEVWSSLFVSGQPDGRSFVVETGSIPYFVESARSDPDADVTANTP